MASVAPIRVIETTTNAQGRFRFETVPDEVVLYSYRRVEPDLCLPQLRLASVRGGSDELHVVLPEPIYGTVSFRARGTSDAIRVHHVTLIVKDATSGATVARCTWSPQQNLESVRFSLWAEGTYDLEVYTAQHEPVHVAGIDAVRGRALSVPVHLVRRR